jgi:hypothetical protein
MSNGYSAYLDASGTRTTPMLVVAGYISTVQDWKTFESQWNRVLDRAKVPYFHMKKFTACQGPFSNLKWRREETRKAFLADLINVIALNVDYGLVNILPMADWTMVNQEYRMEEERLTPFSVAACMAMITAYDWCKARGIPPAHIKFIFEDGDEGKGDLMYWTKKVWGI